MGNDRVNDRLIQDVVHTVEVLRAVGFPRFPRYRLQETHYLTDDRPVLVARPDPMPGLLGGHVPPISVVFVKPWLHSELRNAGISDHEAAVVLVAMAEQQHEAKQAERRLA